MPYRKVILVVGEIYHIFNRSLHDIPIFKGIRETNNFLKAMKFYLDPTPPVKFSIYRQGQKSHLIDLSEPLVKLVAYCLMPTHFHFILFQNKDDGIKTYLQRLTNSYSHYLIQLQPISPNILENTLIHHFQLILVKNIHYRLRLQ